MPHHNIHIKMVALLSSAMLHIKCVLHFIIQSPLSERRARILPLVPTNLDIVYSTQLTYYTQTTRLFSLAAFPKGVAPVQSVLLCTICSFELGFDAVYPFCHKGGGLFSTPVCFQQTLVPTRTGNFAPSNNLCA